MYTMYSMSTGVWNCNCYVFSMDANYSGNATAMVYPVGKVVYCDRHGISSSRAWTLVGDRFANGRAAE